MSRNFTFSIKPTKQLLAERGLENGGRVQKFIDSECIRRMEPYTPFLSGEMQKSATAGTVIGSGKIVYDSLYARYQYYGKLMVSGGNIGKKVLTDVDLIRQKSKHSMAGKLWFERMKADHKKKILEGCVTARDKSSRSN